MSLADRFPLIEGGVEGEERTGIAAGVRRLQIVHPLASFLTAASLRPDDTLALLDGDEDVVEKDEVAGEEAVV